jgi:hypothetical protein
MDSPTKYYRQLSLHQRKGTRPFALLIRCEALIAPDKTMESITIVLLWFIAMSDGICCAAKETAVKHADTSQSIVNSQCPKRGRREIGQADK